MTRTAKSSAAKFLTATVVALAAIAPFASSAQAANGPERPDLQAEVSADDFWAQLNG